MSLAEEKRKEVVDIMVNRLLKDSEAIVRKPVISSFDIQETEKKIDHILTLMEANKFFRRLI